MRIGTLSLAASGLVLCAAMASAHDRQPAQTLPAAQPAPAAPAADLVAGRQAAMRMSAALVGSMKGTIDRGDDVKTQASAAKALLAWSKAIPGMFAPGSFVPPSEALATVWSDPTGFKGKAEGFQIAAQLLAGAAENGDAAGFASAWDQVRGTCGACHKIYKKP